MKLDRLKEELGLLKTIFGIGAVVCASNVAWLVQNYEHAPRLLSICCACLAFDIGLGIVYVLIRARRCLYLLEES